jgi:release factor glutamine methyltransferase
MPDLGALLRQATEQLAAAGVADARRDAGLLVGHALGRDRSWVLAHPDHAPSAGACAEIDRLVARRAAREPMSRIFGRREFWSLDFALDPSTLDPRPDSESLVAAALDHLQPPERRWRVLDLGTGTGCLLLAVLAERPNAVGLGVDRVPAAAAQARRNAAQLGLAERARFMVGDWAQAIGIRFDLVLCNPPYVRSGEVARLEPEVACWDPVAALAGGADGLDAYRRILPELDRLLSPAGAAVLEIGCDQAAAVSAMAEAMGLEKPRISADLAGRPRCIVMEKGKKSLGAAGGTR